MALVTLQEVLKTAENNRTAVPAFNIDNLEIPQVVVEVAEKYACPVILTIGQGAIGAGLLYHLSDVVRRLAAETVIPVVLHLDHGASFEQTILCLRAGFTSVMYDGSHHPFDENVAVTKKVVEAAHAVGVSVEAELGAIGGVEDGVIGGKNLVDVEEVSRFIQLVQVDALAVGIGNAHGIYKATPDLDFERLRQCRNLHSPPPVLHGGSGIPDNMIREAIEIGIRKINVATELRNAFMNGLVAGAKSGNIYTMYQESKKSAAALVEKKIKLFQKLS